MRNLAGLVIIAGGALFAVIGLRGTQRAVFPGLFPASGGVTAGSQPTTGGGSAAAGLPPNLPIYQN